MVDDSDDGDDDDGCGGGYYTLKLSLTRPWHLTLVISRSKSAFFLLLSAFVIIIIIIIIIIFIIITIIIIFPTRWMWCMQQHLRHPSLTTPWSSRNTGGSRISSAPPTSRACRPLGPAAKNISSNHTSFHPTRPAIPQECSFRRTPPLLVSILRLRLVICCCLFIHLSIHPSSIHPSIHIILYIIII